MEISISNIKPSNETLEKCKKLAFRQYAKPYPYFDTPKDPKSSHDPKSTLDHLVSAQQMPNGAIFASYKQANSSLYGLDYIAYKGYLHVTGDLGTATYRWSGDICENNLSFFKNMDGSYFASKLESLDGRRKNSWSSEKAKDYFSEIAHSCLEEELETDEEFNLTKLNEEIDKIDFSEYAFEEWYEQEFKNSIFATKLKMQNCDDLYIPGLGHVDDPCIFHHLFGISIIANSISDTSVADTSVSNTSITDTSIANTAGIADTNK